MKLGLAAVLLLLYTILPQTDGANILVFVGMGSISHRVPIQPLLDSLADRGHSITFLTPHKPKVPNPKIKEFAPNKILKWVGTLDDQIDMFQFRKQGKIKFSWFMLPELGVQLCESLYTDPEYIKWIKDPATKFDVVIMDTLANECAYGMAHHFKAKLVAFNTGQMYSWNFESNLGIPDETSSLPEAMLHFPADMNFFQRVVTGMIPLVWKAYREFWFFPKLEEITKTGLGLKEIPSFKEIEQNTSLYLVNSFWGQEFPRSLPPNVVQIGGIAMQKRENKPLPKNIEDFIKKGKDGFIYVSFGTVAEFTKLDPEIRQAFANMTYKYPNVQFIWKSTHPIQETLPSNVMVEKWLPQKDILAHPKIRLFVTHGGLGGVYEAIYSRVPMLCFPIFADQDYNAMLMANKGFGIKMEITTLKEHEVTEAIGKMLNDPSYKRQIEKVANMHTDRQISPLDLAVWWLEFILRHENTNEFIRPLSATQSWWVRRQLDVWIFVVLISILISSLSLYIVYSILKCTLRKLCGSGGANVQKNRKKKEEDGKKKKSRRAKLD